MTNANICVHIIHTFILRMECRTHYAIYFLECSGIFNKIEINENKLSVFCVANLNVFMYSKINQKIIKLILIRFETK